MRRLELIALFVLAALFAFLVAPFRLGDRTTLVPPGLELDAVLATLVVSDSIDKLLTDPASFYNTAILYPDRTQLRSTEPFLGFALIGLPLRAVPGLNDVDIYELVRWLLVFMAVVYGYGLFRALGAGPAVAAAGAVLCWSHRGLVQGIERLQVVSVPLFLPAIYHAVMLARTERARFGHSLGLFAWTALYPLLGAVNAAIVAAAGLLVLPGLAAIAIRLWRGRGLMVFVVPIALAATVDGIVLAPWLLDRADLSVYVSEEFLQIKHWNPTRLPGKLADVPRYFDGLLGRGIAAAIIATLVLAWSGRRGRDELSGDTSYRDARPEGRAYMVMYGPIIISAILVWAATVARFSDALVWWLTLAFHVLSWATLLWLWRDLVRSRTDVGALGALLSLGLAIYVGLMSFGPAYVSNDGELANGPTRALVEILPPLKSIREFNRLWLFAAISLSVYATLRLADALRDRGPTLQSAVAILVALAAASSLGERALVASSEIEAPRDLVELVSHSRRKGGVYIHPDLVWNSRSGVFAIAAAKDTKRPFVNGYLGISLPWFDYASRVLHRFPEPEAMWLLRKWNVDTVVSQPGAEVGAPPGFVKAFEGSAGTAWDADSGVDSPRHPSEWGSPPPPPARVGATWTPAASGTGIVIAMPEQFHVAALELTFTQSIVRQIPPSADVYLLTGTRGPRLNADAAGTWLESLAADALLHRRSPVAVIRLRTPNEPADGGPSPGEALIVEFPPGSLPPIERVVLLGEWN